MVRIEVDAETARKIELALEPIELVDDRGRRIGFFARPISSEEVAEAKRRADAKGEASSLDEVWNRIKSIGGHE